VDFQHHTLLLSDARSINLNPFFYQCDVMACNYVMMMDYRSSIYVDEAMDSRSFASNHLQFRETSPSHIHLLVQQRNLMEMNKNFELRHLRTLIVYELSIMQWRDTWFFPQLDDVIDNGIGDRQAAVDFSTWEKLPRKTTGIASRRISWPPQAVGSLFPGTTV
jgi:hypothetical protein